MGSGALFIETFFRPDLVARYLPEIFRAMFVTIAVAGLVVLTGLLLGLLLAVARSYRSSWVSALVVFFADIFRALPPLVLVLIAYFGLPNVGISLSNYVVLWLVLSLVLAAFAEETLWAGLLSIRKGQWDAARSTGLGFSGCLAHVVLPQAIRLCVPPLTSRAIVITKNTALGSVIGVPEILNVASTAQSVVGNSTPLMLGALAYVLLFAPLVMLGRWIESRFEWRRA